MNREIKFRAFVLDRSEMFKVENMCFFGRPYATIQYNPVVKYPLSDIELMQFTGLYDKNGKEIYEGDILRVLDLYDEGGEHETYTTIVKKYGEIDVRGEEFDYTLLKWAELEEYEIIGNIYENPELLEVRS